MTIANNHRNRSSGIGDDRTGGGYRREEEDGDGFGGGYRGQGSGGQFGDGRRRGKGTRHNFPLNCYELALFKTGSSFPPSERHPLTPSSRDRDPFSTRDDGDQSSSSSSSSDLVVVRSNTIVGDRSHSRGMVVARIVRGNIPVENGVVHLIDKPLMIVAKSLYEYIMVRKEIEFFLRSSNIKWDFFAISLLPFLAASSDAATIVF